MPIVHGAVLIAWLCALVLELGIVLAIAYGVLRFATKFQQMRRDIEELKMAVRELGRTA